MLNPKTIQIPQQARQNLTALQIESNKINAQIQILVRTIIEVSGSNPDAQWSVMPDFSMIVEKQIKEVTPDA